MSDAESADHAPGKIEVTSPALKGFRRLPEKAAAAIIEFVTGALADNPYRLSKPLTSELLGLRTARRGDYRVLFTLDAKAMSYTSSASNTDQTSTKTASCQKTKTWE